MKRNKCGAWTKKKTRTYSNACTISCLQIKIKKNYKQNKLITIVSFEIKKNLFNNSLIKQNVDECEINKIIY